ncbi:MAG TPA: alpha/beta hydrolase [Mucilaginibacter sp.]|nr:alpha/beta hydrolase [Mucilaginibacter sp.]
MKKQVLFIQGGGNGGYEADSKLVALLQKLLGEDYELSYPRMKTDEAAPNFGWLKQIGNEIDKLGDDIILVAHSFGASLLLKYLSENRVSKKVAEIFLVATPFWSGKEEWVQGLKLQEDFGESLPKNSRIFFYHCRDDEEITFDHLASYRHKLPAATFREIESGGHQLDNHLNLVAKDIKACKFICCWKRPRLFRGCSCKPQA